MESAESGLKLQLFVGCDWGSQMPMHYPHETATPLLAVEGPRRLRRFWGISKLECADQLGTENKSIRTLSDGNHKVCTVRLFLETTERHLTHEGQEFHL